MSTAGPYTLQFPIIQTGLLHLQEFNCDVLGTPAVGDDPSDVTMRTRVGDGVDLETAATALWGVIRAMYNPSSLCSTYALFKRNVDNENRDFISGGSLSAPNGSSAGAAQLAHQTTLTYRTAGKGILKLVFIEDIWTQQIRLPLNSGSAAEFGPINGYILGDDNIVMARNRTFPVAPLAATGGQNEKVFKRRYRA
jgi:hypothetical protein